MKIIHITDSLPFYVGGVSDYAYKLSSELKDKYGIDSYFITVKKFDNYDKSKFNKIYNIYKRKNLFETVNNIVAEEFNKDDKITVILPFVGYAYQNRGCPLWLLHELRKLKKHYSIKLITIFHELYAVSNNMKSSVFWLSWLQKYIAKEIFFLSDSTKTNNIKYYNELKEWDNTKKIDLLPVFSNVGESQPTNKFNNRENSIIVFGSKVSRENVYKHKDFNKKLMEHFNIEKIFDIGSGDIDFPNIDIEFIKLGRLDINEIEKIMLNVKFGLIEYRNMPLGKSGIFSSYIAHGVVPIVLSCYNKESLYKPEQHYILKNSILDIEKFSDISKFILKEYLKNASLQNHVSSCVKEIL